MKRLSFANNRYWMWLLLIGFMACQPSQHQSSVEESAPAETEAEMLEETDAEQAGEDQSLDSRMDSQSSRGLGQNANARLAGTSPQSRLPLLYKLLEEQQDYIPLVEPYAHSVFNRQALQSEQDLVQLLDDRSQLENTLTSLLENQDGQWLDLNWDALEKELNSIGFTMLAAEGMFIGVGQTDFLTDVVERLGSDALQWYLKFEYARFESANGEYPYLDMQPYANMIEAGAKLEELLPNPYFKKVEPYFFQALESMADIHSVGDEAARQSREQVFVGGINTEFYPYSTETADRTRFVSDGNAGRYQAMMERILSNMSEMEEKPENLYLILTEWIEEEEMARARVYENLKAGIDIPHRLKIRRVNGNDQYGICYRFYQDDQKAENALKTILPDYPQAQLIMVSVRGEELYEMASAMD